MQPLSGNQRPDLLTSLMNMSFVLCLPREMHLWRSSSNVPRLPAFLEMLQNPPPLQKCSVPFSFFALLTSKCASRHNGVHFFNIWTSKSGPTLRCFVHFLRNVLRATTACTFSTSQLPKGPTLRCFVHFDFEMCFAPQRRALFRHLNFQKCSETQVFCTFWLANVLRATTACNFSSLIWPAGSAPAALASLLFDPPELSYLFSHLHLLSSVYSFFLLFFLLIFLFSLPLPCSAFHLSILSEVWL